MVNNARLARAYFDLNAVAVVEDEVRAVLRDVKARWREVLAGLLRDAGVSARSVEQTAVWATATIEGFCLEWIERGDTPGLNQARELFVRALSGAVNPR